MHLTIIIVPLLAEVEARFFCSQLGKGALEALGYYDGQRMLAPRQVRVIEEFLGEAG